MAIDTKCTECQNMVTASLSNHYPLCDTCRRKHGWKPWEEMTLAEKVEDLNKRIERVDDRSALIG